MTSLQPDSRVMAELLKRGMSQGQRPYLTISSGSMRPLLVVGDEIQLEPVTIKDLLPGDIITVVAPVELLTHRFYGVYENDGCTWLVTRGDRFLLFDSAWHEAQLVGRVITRRRHKRRRLSLREGGGKWLNGYMGRLAAAETRFFGARHMPLPPLHSFTLTPGWGSKIPFFWVRQIRRILYLWLTLVAFVVRVLAS